MPYSIFKVKGGFKVGKSDGKPMRNGRMFASDKPLTKKNAEKQMRAMYAREKISNPTGYFKERDIHFCWYRLNPEK